MGLFGKDASAGGGLYKAYERSLREVETPVIPVKNCDVAVFSLLNGRGTTHTAAAIANFLSEDEDNKMAFFTKEEFESKKLKDSFEEEYLRSDIALIGSEHKTEVARLYTSVVEDVGVVEDFTSLPSSKTLICVCTADTKFLHRLAVFAEHPRAKDVFYVFNVTDETKVAHIKHIMELYRLAGFISQVYPVKNPPRAVKLLFRNILITDNLL